MAEESVARRYAAALMNQSLQAGTLDAVAGELSGVSEALIGAPALGAFLKNPLVTRERKTAVVAQLFEKDASAATMRFLNLLVEKRRIDLFGEVKAEFDRLVRAHKNIASATAVSATPLSAAQTRELEKALEARTGKDIELTCEVDPSLMGGLLVRLGDTVLDGTVKGKLDRLREQLLTRK